MRIIHEDVVEKKFKKEFKLHPLAVHLSLGILLGVGLGMGMDGFPVPALAVLTASLILYAK